MTADTKTETDDNEVVAKILSKYGKVLLVILVFVTAFVCCVIERNQYAEVVNELQKHGEISIKIEPSWVIRTGWLSETQEQWFSRKVINIKFNDSVTDVELKSIEKLDHGLRGLELEGCNKITDAGLKSIEKLPYLISLNLNGCNSITDAGFKAIEKQIHLRDL